MLLKFPNSLWRQCTRKCARESHNNMISSIVNRRSSNRKYSTSRRNTTNHKSDDLQECNSIRVSGDNSIHTAHSDINSKLLANTPELLAYCLSMSTPLHPALGLFNYFLAVLRIRDVYPGSWFLPIPDLGSRIPDPKTATNSHKFNKIVHYFMFEMLNKKVWANFQRIIELLAQKIVTKLSKIWVWDPRSGIRKKPIPDPGSGGQKGTGSRIRIPDPDPQHCFLAVLWIRNDLFTIRIFCPPKSKSFRNRPLLGPWRKLCQ